MDFCCGTTMTARIAPMETEGGSLLTDVPFLLCNTCGHMVIAPNLEFDVTMYAHYLETDGVKSASLMDVVDQDRILAVCQEYPETERHDGPYVSDAQLDHMLDLWNIATYFGDAAWIDDIKERLLVLHKVRCTMKQLQEQS